MMATMLANNYRMPNDWFEFKQFRIEQDRCAMKVGTDSVILGAWTPCQDVKTIVDLGSGTGLLSLMLAQRCKARITAIELDMDAALQSAHNFAKSPWPHLIESICGNIADLKYDLKGRFDLAIFNPPYFGGHLRPDNTQRSIARHLPKADLNSKKLWLEAAYLMTTNNGVTSFVIPQEDEHSWMEAANTLAWHCTKKLIIFGNINSKPKRCILYFSKQSSEIETSELIIETSTRGEYSEDFKAIASPFYLNF
jgi:tRNA1Val (adenine37-N6)-methyltransferase